MLHTEQWKRREWLTGHGTNDLLVMSLKAGQGELATLIMNRILPLPSSRIHKNYVIFLK